MTIRKRLGITSAWSMEVGLAALGLLIGVGLMPMLIFWAGTSVLGAYEGVSLGHLYQNLFSGLGSASIASWVVVLGPYGLYLLCKGLGVWWRASATSA